METARASSHFETMTSKARFRRSFTTRAGAATAIVAVASRTNKLRRNSLLGNSFGVTVR